MTNDLMKNTSLGQALWKAIWAVFLMTALLGIAYPVFMTITANMLFPHQANGSLIAFSGRLIGSEMIGQDFSKTPYFQSRPSAAGEGYDATASSGTNFATTNEKQRKAIAQRTKHWQTLTGNYGRVPVDLVTASSSGLDPHISLAAALYQVPVVSRNTGLPAEQLKSLVLEQTMHGLFGGPQYVNVLKLNLNVAIAVTENKHKISK